jgi:hypothetical protein
MNDKRITHNVNSSHYPGSVMKFVEIDKQCVCENYSEHYYDAQGKPSPAIKEFLKEQTNEARSVADYRRAETAVNQNTYNKMSYLRKGLHNLKIILGNNTIYELADKLLEGMIPSDQKKFISYICHKN